MAGISDDDREELTAYLDGEADPATRARIEARLNREPTLRVEAEQMRKAWDLLDHLPKPESSPTFTTRTLDKLSAIRPASSTSTLALPREPWRIRWDWLAAIAIGLLVGWIVAGGIRPRGPMPLRPDDPLLVRDLRIIENLSLYAPIPSIEYLNQLDHPDRFGADSVGP